MYFHIAGKEISEILLREIGVITNYARLPIKKVHFDNGSKSIILQLNRRPLMRRKLLGIPLGKVYEKSSLLDCVVTIRNVVDCTVCNKAEDLGHDEITLLFGIEVRQDRISLYSAEEHNGESMYSIVAKIDEIDFEIRDTL